MSSERVILADGEAEQALIPGVAPVSQTARDLGRARMLRDMRRAHLPLWRGSLFDDCARAQRELL